MGRPAVLRPLARLRAAIVLVLCGLACRVDSQPVKGAGSVRPAVHAGTWYPGEPAALRAALSERLARSGPPVTADRPLAIIVPHAGLRFSGEVAASAYALVAHAPPARVILLGPAHHLAFRGVALPAPDLTAYATPLGDLTIDRKAIEELRGKPGFDGPAAAHGAEHSLEMQAIFIAQVAPRARLVPLVVGRIDDPRAIASRLRGLLRAGDLVVVSSDFTHYGESYGYLPFTTDVPAGLAALLGEAKAALIDHNLGDFENHLARTHDTICGREAIRILLSLLPDTATGIPIRDDTSGRQTGDFRTSVTYLAMAYVSQRGWTGSAARPAAPATPPAAGELGERLDRADKDAALRLARRTLEIYLRTGVVPSEAELGVPPSPALRRVRGAFVTLTIHGRLRGCIGHIEPILPLWQDVRDNAIAAAVHDPRFPPVAAAELGEISIEISALTSQKSVPGVESIQIGRHGVVLEVSGRRAVFLPQVAPEQHWDRDTMLNHLAVKAGAGRDAWRDPSARFWTFEADVFAEHQD